MGGVSYQKGWVNQSSGRIISPLEKHPCPQLLVPVSVPFKVFVDSCRLISVCGFLIYSLTFTWYSFGLLICLLGQSFAQWWLQLVKKGNECRSMCLPVTSLTVSIGVSITPSTNIAQYSRHINYKNMPLMQLSI